MGAPYFSGLKTLMHELIFVKNNFHLESIKNDNTAVKMSNNFYNADRVNNSIIL